MCAEPLIQPPSSGDTPFQDEDYYILSIYVPPLEKSRISTRSPTLVLDKYTGSDEEMITPRWAETLVFGEEYKIYDMRSVVTRLIFKHALREVNLEVVSSITTLGLSGLSRYPILAKSLCRGYTMGSR